MKALITGAEGFIGGHLASLLDVKGYDVWVSVEDKRLTKSQFNPSKTLECDIRLAEEVERTVSTSQPDVIYHLAAQSYPTLSWKNPQHTFEVNVTGTINVFEAILRNNMDSKVVVACSSAEYGAVPENDLPVREEHSLLPLHPYGVSKVAQDLLTYQYYKNYGIKGVRARIFNTTGPGKVKDAVGDFAKRVAEFEKGKLTKVTHGNLEVLRDITDVRDMVRALNFCEKADPGQEYNLCSMNALKISDVFQKLINMSTKKVLVEQDKNLMRPSDERIILGDNTKFTRKTGWKPEISIEQTLADTLTYWRER